MKNRGIYEKVVGSTDPQSTPRRKRGEGRIWLMGRVWWIQYYAHGRQVRESSHSEKESEAERLLRKRRGEIEAGIFVGPSAQRVRYEQLRDTLYADYRTNHRKSLYVRKKDGFPLICGVPELDEFFAGYRAAHITADRIRAFVAKRQSEGASNSTINRSLAALRHMFYLAVEDKKLRTDDVPHFPMLKEPAARKGFLEHDRYARLGQELPEYLRPVLTMGYYTGMRRGEILALRWENVSLLDGQVRLDPGATKNDEPRVIPLAGELLEVLKIQRQKYPDSEYVFTRDDKPIGSFRKVWTSACRRAGLEGLLFHDLRRTGIRNLVRAGVPERVAMAISGHKTRAVFERYNIVSERDLRDAASKLETYLAQKTGQISGQITQESEKDRVAEGTQIN